MPGTPFPTTPAMTHTLRLWELPHAGGDPDLAAERAERSGAQVRVLTPSEKTTKPACTITLGGVRFEITHPVTGRKPSVRDFASTQMSLEADLPSHGWISVPANLSDIEADYASLKAVRDAGRTALGGHGSFLSTVVALAGSEFLHQKGLERLRDDYAKRVGGL